jgi:hypothetical protein
MARPKTLIFNVLLYYSTFTLEMRICLKTRPTSWYTCSGFRSPGTSTTCQDIFIKKTFPSSQPKTKLLSSLAINVSPILSHFASSILFFFFSLLYLSLFPLSISLNKFSVIFTPVGISLCEVCSSCKPSKRLHRDMSVFQQNMMKLLSFDFSCKKAKI